MFENKYGKWSVSSVSAIRYVRFLDLVCSFLNVKKCRYVRTGI